VKASNDSTHTCSLTMEITGIGHVPSFKNSKSIYRKKNGTPFIATKRERKDWMEKATLSIERQLRSAFQTRDNGTSTEQHLRSWIASSMPLDDSRQWIAELNINLIEVEKGMEGASVRIEKV
jgi:hypothetical protein